jgi:hypothetical protein
MKHSTARRLCAKLDGRKLNQLPRSNIIYELMDAPAIVA